MTERTRLRQDRAPHEHDENQVDGLGFARARRSSGFIESDVLEVTALSLTQLKTRLS